MDAAIEHRQELVKRYRALALDAKERAKNWSGLGLDWDQVAKSYDDLADKLEHWSKMWVSGRT